MSIESRYAGKNESASEFNTLNLDIYRRYIRSEWHNLEEIVFGIFMTVIDQASLERGAIFSLNTEGNEFSLLEEFYTEGMDEVLSNMKYVPLDLFPYWFQEIKQNHMITIDDVDKMANIARLECDILKDLGIGSVAAKAVIGDSGVIGFVAFSAGSNPHPWSARELELLQSCSDIVGNLIIKKRMISGFQKELNEYDIALKQMGKALDEAKRFSLEAAFANSSKSEFLTKFCEEVQNSISNIGTIRQQLNECDLSENTESILLPFESVNRFVSNIIDYLKIENENLDLEIQPFNISEIIANLKQNYKQRFTDLGISLNCSISSRIPENLLGDSQRVGQIMECLVENALKFEPDSAVWVSLDSLSGDSSHLQLRLTVRDDGAGITEDDLEFLFEPFYKVCISDGQDCCGGGINLSICKALVDLMNGRVEVINHGEGGMEFQVIIPVQTSDEKEEEVLNSKDSDAHSGFEDGKINVLLIEDNPVNRKVAQKILIKLGCSAIVTSNRIEAVGMLDRCQPDLVFVDIDLQEPDKNVSLHSFCQQLSGSKPVPVLVMTAENIEAQWDVFSRQGISDWIAKPFPIGLLKEKIEKWAINPKQDESGSEKVESEQDFLDPSIFNRQEILDRLGGDEGALGELLPVYVMDVSERLDRIKSQLGEDDLEPVRNEAHTIKGASYNIGAKKLGDSAYDLELTAKGQITDQSLNDVFGQVKRNFWILCSRLKHEGLVSSDDISGLSGLVESGESV